MKEKINKKINERLYFQMVLSTESFLQKQVNGHKQSNVLISLSSPLGTTHINIYGTSSRIKPPILAPSNHLSAVISTCPPIRVSSAKFYGLCIDYKTHNHPADSAHEWNGG